MSNPIKFMEEFGLKKGSKFAGYELQETSVISYQPISNIEYRYDITIIYKCTANNKMSPVEFFNNHVFVPRLIDDNRLGRYKCYLTRIDHSESFGILKIKLKGESFKITSN